MDSFKRVMGWYVIASLLVVFGAATIAGMTKYPFMVTFLLLAGAFLLGNAYGFYSWEKRLRQRALDEEAAVLRSQDQLFRSCNSQGGIKQSSNIAYGKPIIRLNPRVSSDKAAGDGEISRRNFFFQGPERVGDFIGYLLPRGIRESAFNPYFEELKEDRLERKAKAKSASLEIIIEIFFYFRLTVSFLDSLRVWLLSPVSKMISALKMLL